MTTTRATFATSVLVAALALALSSCADPQAGAGAPSDAAATRSGSSDPGATPHGAAEPTPAAQVAEAVETTFRAYNQALLARDYAVACGFNAPETTKDLIGALAAQGVTVGTCEEAFSTVYAIPGAAEAADTVANTLQVTGVRIDGDEATVTWSAETTGTRRTVDSALRMVDGGWRLLSAEAA